MNFGINLPCTISSISQKNTDSFVILKLNETPLVITIKTTKGTVDNLKLKENDCAYAAIFWWNPKEPPYTGKRMVTVFVQNNWVTIPIGNVAPSLEPESDECVKIMDTSLSMNAIAKKYGYPDIDSFLLAVHSSLNNFGRCPPQSFVKQIESLREYEIGWKWHTFRYGPTCKARICQMKENSKPSDAQNEAWMHGYLTIGDYNDEKRDSLTTAEGIFDGPVLAGFCYTGTRDRPDPNMLFRGSPSYNRDDKDLFHVPVNIFKKKETTTEKIGRTTVESVGRV